jgi:hypothetical protein
MRRKTTYYPADEIPVTKDVVRERFGALYNFAGDLSPRVFNYTSEITATLWPYPIPETPSLLWWLPLVGEKDGWFFTGDADDPVDLKTGGFPEGRWTSSKDGAQFYFGFSLELIESVFFGRNVAAFTAGLSMPRFYRLESRGDLLAVLLRAEWLLNRLRSDTDGIWKHITLDD